MLGDDDSDAGSKPTEEGVLKRAEEKEKKREEEKIRRLDALHQKVHAEGELKKSIAQQLTALREETMQERIFLNECLQFCTIAYLAKTLGSDGAPMIARIAARLGKRDWATDSKAAEEERSNSSPRRDSDSTPARLQRVDSNGETPRLKRIRKESPLVSPKDSPDDDLYLPDLDHDEAPASSAERDQEMATASGESDESGTVQIKSRRERGVISRVIHDE